MVKVYISGPITAPTEDEIRTAVSGNLCRCTGYDGIIKAIATVARTHAR